MTDFQATGVDGKDVSFGAPPGFVPITNSYEVKVKDIGTVRARLGALLCPDLLAYVTGGWAYGQVERSWNLAFTEDGASVLGTSGHDNSTDMGWTVGGGLEWALTDHWVLGGEYLFVRLGSEQFQNNTFFFSPGFGGFACAHAGTNCNFHIDASEIDNHIARANLNYRF